jgi:hypothetical protein
LIALLLNINAQVRHCVGMKHTLYRLSGLAPTLILAIVLFAVPIAVEAGCYAEYKAKRDNPLKLHYGVAELDDAACTKAQAQKMLAPRLKADNWVLLSIVGFVAQDKLDEVKANAGDYFLRY